MGLDATAYARQLKALLPTGPAWSAANAETVLGKLLLAIGDELARITARSDDLLREIDPASTTELINEWEKMLGLPDECIDAVETLQERRQAIVAKYTLIGGQSRQFFIDLAAAIGFTITITEFPPFTAGSSAGDSVSSPEAGWPWTWRVQGPEETIRDFRAGQNTSGDALRSWGNEKLECLISSRKPAHTVLQFAYGT